jgi:hypothetical protein
MQVGEVIDIDTCMTTPIMRVDGTYPVKYNGENNEYVVCIPEEATHIVISCVDTDGDKINMVLVKDFEGKDTLIDLF